MSKKVKMITEKEIIEILKDKNLFKHKSWGTWRKAIAKSIIEKIKENVVFLKGNAFKFIAQNKKFEQIDFIQTTISPEEKSIGICISESRKNKKYQKRN